MDITQIYAIAAGGFFALIGLIQLWLRIARFLRRRTYGLLLRHIVYPYLIRRHRFLGPWTRSSVLLHFSYLAIIAFCNAFGVKTLDQASMRAGTLSLINTVPLYFGFHISFVADILGFSLQLYKRIHRTIALVSTALGLFHVIVSATSGSSGSLGRQRVYGLTVCSRRG